MAAILDFSTSRLKKTLKSAKVQNIQFFPKKKQWLEGMLLLIIATHHYFKVLYQNVSEE